MQHSNLRENTSMQLDWQNVSTWQVLLVDDEVDNLEVIAETLEFHGAKLRTAKNGVEALAIVESYIPNLILLALYACDGWIARHRLRENPKIEANTPIIA